MADLKVGNALSEEELSQVAGGSGKEISDFMQVLKEKRPDVYEKCKTEAITMKTSGKAYHGPILQMLADNGIAMQIKKGVPNVYMDAEGNQHTHEEVLEILKNGH